MTNQFRSLVVGTLLLCFCLVWSEGASTHKPEFAVVTAQSPAQADSVVPGFFAKYSASVPVAAKLADLHVFFPGNRSIGHLLSSNASQTGIHLQSGCEPYSKPGNITFKFVAVVNDSQNCTGWKKAKIAANAGAAGILIVSSGLSRDAILNGNGDTLNLLVLAVPKGFDDLLVSDSRISVANYDSPGIITVSKLCVIALATMLVVLGAFFATADLRLGSPLALRPHEEFVEVDNSFPLAFFLVGSFSLVVLFFLMRYLIYVIIFIFCVGGWSALAHLVYLLFKYYYPRSQKTACTLPVVQSLQVGQVVAGLLSAVVVVCWFVLRNKPSGWFFQDIIGTAFLCSIQRHVRLPNIKVATALLTLMFVFDIFWVFISPVIFKKSVMVEVAKGGNTGESVPLLLRIPIVGDPFGGEQMLGFGDVALPGLLISFLRRFDVLSRKPCHQGYFMPSVLGYSTAMFVTILALYLMNKGQPALLYLVPGTLGTTLLLALRRGEVRALWEGNPNPDARTSRLALSMSACRYCPNGHPLLLMSARAGTCDGCRQIVHGGQQVMECRACDWYLCSTCRPEIV